MGDIFGFFKNLFGRDNSNSNKIPFLHESIDLKSFPEEELKKWKLAGNSEGFSKILNAAYRDFYITNKAQGNSESVTILDSSHSNGWFLHCDKLTFKDSSYKYFAHELSKKLKGQKYFIQLAELKSIAKPQGIETVTHYYLKPSIKFQFEKSQNQSNQLYGNISIEYKAINGNPKSFKFLAKAYSDSKYLPPLDFSELTHILFGV